jgi:hypothetical protein
MASVAIASGTRLLRFDFMRAAGNVQTLPGRSISSDRSPSVSHPRAPVRITNSSTNRALLRAQRDLEVRLLAYGNAGWCWIFCTLNRAAGSSPTPPVSLSPFSSGLSRFFEFS